MLGFRKFITFVIPFLTCILCGKVDNKIFAQTKTLISFNTYKLQYGYSLNAFLEFGFSKQDPKPVIRITASGGVGSVFLCDNIYPTLNTEFLLYNGGIGSRNKSLINKFSFDAIIALTLTGGIKNHFRDKWKYDLGNRNVPLYYFSDFTRPALQNPFSNSMSVGTNLIFTTDKGKKNQRIGFLNVHISNFQFSYFNDGGAPISGIYLGDRADRYFTGGGLVSINFPNHVSVNTISLSYLKYSGYSKSAFEVSNKLYLNYMNYHDSTQQEFNKSLWSIGLANTKKGIGLNYKYYNDIDWDLQHRIHTALFNAFHMVPYEKFCAVSVSYFNAKSFIGTK